MPYYKNYQTLHPIGEIVFEACDSFANKLLFEIIFES